MRYKKKKSSSKSKSLKDFPQLSMREETTALNKEKLLAALKSNCGLVYKSCEMANISPTSYYKYMNDDPEFRQKARDINGMTGDTAESQLFNLIEGGDIQAIMFYLKTKGRDRGYGNTLLPQEKRRIRQMDSGIDVEEENRKNVERKVQLLTTLLQKEGKYTAELTVQIEITAQALVRLDNFSREVMSSGYQPTMIQTSREGNERQLVNPTEQLYSRALDSAQRALRALGMNTDAKDKKIESDGLNEFMEAFKNDE